MDNTACSLPPWDSITDYRDLIAEAVEQAEAAADPKLKEMHVDRALRWLAHVHEAEHAAELGTEFQEPDGLPVRREPTPARVFRTRSSQLVARIVTKIRAYSARLPTSTNGS